MGEFNDAGKPAVAAGQHVLYVPHFDHHLDLDHNRARVWEFEYEKDGPRHRAGDRVTRFVSAPDGKLQRAEGGQLLTDRGEPVRPARPLRPWPAVVRAAHGDGSADLDVKDPSGCSTLHYDRVPCDPSGRALHTYHACPQE
jgi:hypothetical protein